MRKPWKTFRVKTKPKLSCLLIGPHHFPSLTSLPVNGSKQQTSRFCTFANLLQASLFLLVFRIHISTMMSQCHMTCCPAHILWRDHQNSKFTYCIFPTHFKVTCFVVTSHKCNIFFPPVPAERPENTSCNVHTRTVPCPRYFCCETSTVTVSIVT